MPKTDPRVDAYIAKSAEFARPILTELRAIVHQACPEVEETIKWGFPHFQYRGILCSMAAFKEHASFGFWKAELLGLPNRGGEDGGMGSFGKLTTRKDLPSKKALIALTKQAMALNAAGAPVPSRAKKAPKAALPEPADFTQALKADNKAKATWDAFPPGCRREYLEWIGEAKREETRAKRLAQTLEWLAEGKKRNWKYENC